MTNTARRRPSHEQFAVATTALAALFVAVVGWQVYAGPSSASDSSAYEPGAGLPIDGSPAAGSSGIDLDDGTAPDPNLSVDDLIVLTADTMGAVTSVEFAVEKSGAPIYIDSFESIAITSLLGQFSVPGQAQATIDVTVDGNLNTLIGAIAYNDEIWISNPITGLFEPLPTGYDIDPSKFFDPSGGWQPLIENLQGAEIVSIDDRYHLRGVAAAADVANITVGLIDDQNVEVDFEVHPGGYITRAEFDTIIDGDTAEWELSLDRYGAEFVITPPEEVINQ